MKSKKGLKHYASIFVFSTIALVLYLIYFRIREGDFDFEVIRSFAVVPILFTSLLFVFDQILDKIFPKKGKKGNVKFNSFLQTASLAIQNECNFTIEEYSKLRTGLKFQKGIGQAFRIYDKGENDDLNIEFLDRKFKKGTNDYVAFQVVIKVVKELMENS